LAIEDSIYGVIAAKRAGINVIGVASGTNKKRELISAGATMVFKNLKELYDYLIEEDNKNPKKYNVLFTPRRIESRIQKILQQEEFDCSLDLSDTDITSLGSLESVYDFLDLSDTSIASLGSLRSVGGWLDLSNTNITSLGSLKEVGTYLYLCGTNITDFGSLRSAREIILYKDLESDFDNLPDHLKSMVRYSDC